MEKNGTVLLHKPRSRVSVAPWTWELKSEDLEALIAVRNVVLSKASKLPAKIARAIAAVKPELVLHRFG